MSFRTPKQLGPNESAATATAVAAGESRRVNKEDNDDNDDDFVVPLPVRPKPPSFRGAAAVVTHDAPSQQQSRPPILSQFASLKAAPSTDVPAKENAARDLDDDEEEDRKMPAKPLHEVSSSPAAALAERNILPLPTTRDDHAIPETIDTNASMFNPNISTLDDEESFIFRPDAPTQEQQVSSRFKTEPSILSLPSVLLPSKEAQFNETSLDEPSSVPGMRENAFIANQSQLLPLPTNIQSDYDHPHDENEGNARQQQQQRLPMQLPESNETVAFSIAVQNNLSISQLSYPSSSHVPTDMETATMTPHDAPIISNQHLYARQSSDVEEAALSTPTVAPKVSATSSPIAKRRILWIALFVGLLILVAVATVVAIVTTQSNGQSSARSSNESPNQSTVGDLANLSDGGTKTPATDGKLVGGPTSSPTVTSPTNVETPPTPAPPPPAVDNPSPAPTELDGNEQNDDENDDEDVDANEESTTSTPEDNLTSTPIPTVRPTTETPTNVNPSPTTAPTLMPTMAPTTVPTQLPTRAVPVTTFAPIPSATTSDEPAVTRSAQIVTFINSITLSGQTFADPSTVPLEQLSSAEEGALLWLILEDPLDLVPDTPARAFRLRQRYALMTLKFQQWLFALSDWTNVDGWGDEEECNWFGVTCVPIEVESDGDEQFAVAAIELPENNIFGNFPADFGLLQSMQVIDVSSNAIGGSLPSSIGTLTNLHTFLANGNELTGTMPDLGSLLLLDTFNLRDNFINGSLPPSIGQWSNLRYFSVSDNMLTGPIPDSVGNWAIIDTASFALNDFAGAVPEELCSIQTLSTILVDCSCPPIPILGIDSCTLEVECSCCWQCYDDDMWLSPPF